MNGAANPDIIAVLAEADDEEEFFVAADVLRNFYAAQEVDDAVNHLLARRNFGDVEIH